MKKLLTFLMMSVLAIGVGWAGTVTGTITFGTNNVKIDDATVTGDDNQGNTWTISTVGTTSFTQNSAYSQVGSGSKPATSITFTTTLPNSVEITSMSAKFGGFSGTAGTITLKVDDATVGTGSLNATNDVIVSSTASATGTVLTVTVTNISKGVKCYYISYSYEDDAVLEQVKKPTFSIPAGRYYEAKSVAISCETSGATIYYTTDGNDPTTSSSVYSTAIAVNSITTIKAMAVKDGMTNSEVASARYVIIDNTPAQPGEEVMFDYRKDAEFAQENATAMEQSSKQGITIDFAEGTGENIPTWYSSSYGNARVYKNNTITVNAGDLVIEKVTFAFEGTSVISDPTLSIGSYDSGSGVWTVGGKSAVLTMNAGASATRIATITVKLADAGVIIVTPPIISGEESFVESTEVTITAEDGAIIYYTTDGENPTTLSTQYTVPFTISETTTVKAIAVIGDNVSNVTSKTFTALEITLVESVAQFNGLADNTDLMFTGANLVAIAQHGKYLYTQDLNAQNNAKGMLIYEKDGTIGQTYNLNDVIPARFTGKKVTYNNLPEMINPSGFTQSTSQASLTPLELTPANVTLDNFSRYIVIRYATIDETNKIFVVDEENISYHNTFGITMPENPEGKTYDVYGLIDVYNNKPQIIPMSFEEVTVPEGPSYYLVGSFNTYEDNGETKWVTNDPNYKFNKKASGGYYLNDIELAADVEFKIIKVEGESDPVWYGGTVTGDGTYFGINGDCHTDIQLVDGANFKMGSAGINDFEISSDMKLTINRDAQLYMKGSYSNDNWATKTPLTKTDAGWTTTIELNADTEFKFIDEWETWYGGGEVTEITESNLGNSIPITKNGGNNFTVKQAGNYTFNVNSALNTLVVTKELVAHSITVASGIEHGTVTTDVASALAGEVITISVTPDDGYIPDVITVMAGETSVAMIGNTFVMPDADVTVSTTFKQFEVASNFKLVTNINQLEAGKQILVVGKKDETGVYVMNTTGDDNRKSTVLNETGVLPGYISYVEGYNSLVLGTSGNYYTFFEVGNKGYLQPGTNSSKNHLIAGDCDKNALGSVEISDNGSFEIVFSESTNTRNYLQFNASNNPPLFSCYANTQSPVYLYVETEAVEYTITVAECENGRIEEVTAETAAAGSDIYFTVVPAENYAVNAVSITTSNGTNVEYESDDDIYTFVMPAADVTISATFKKVATILEGVSFTADRHWATWCGEEKLSMPTGVTAYVVTGVSNGKVQIAEKDVVNSGEGVLLYCENEMAEVTAAVATNATNAATNLLVGCLEPATVSDAYVLYNNNFVLVQNGTTVGAHRCYLPMNSVTQNAPMLHIAMPGTVTGIEDLRYDSNGKPVGYYDLTGRYIGTSLNGKRGIFITSDGKKVVR